MDRKELFEITSLRLFVSLADMGSISRVAAGLEATQPVISRRLASIEQAWGGRLFHRTGRGVVLTEFGSGLLPQVKALLAEVSQLAHEIAGGGGEIKGLVRIAAAPSISVVVVPMLMQHFQASGLDIRLEILEGSAGQIEEWVAEGRSDISILYRHGKAKAGEVAVKVVNSCLVGAATDPRLSRSTIKFSQLDQLPLVLAPYPSPTSHRLGQIAQRQKISLNVALEAASLGLQKLLPEICGFYTVLPFFVVANEVRAGRLGAATLIEPTVPLSIWVGHGTTTVLEPAVKEVMRILTRYLPKLLDEHFGESAGIPLAPQPSE